MVRAWPEAIHLMQQLYMQGITSTSIYIVKDCAENV